MRDDGYQTGNAVVGEVLPSAPLSAMNSLGGWPRASLNPKGREEAAVSSLEETRVVIITMQVDRVLLNFRPDGSGGSKWFPQLVLEQDTKAMSFYKGAPGTWLISHPGPASCAN